MKDPPSHARDQGSIPAWGTKISHASGQLNLHITTTDQAFTQQQRPMMPQNVLKKKETTNNDLGKKGYRCAQKMTQNSNLQI